MKDCPDGTLTLDEFKKIYGIYFPFGNSPTFVEHVFRTFDTNQGGNF